MLRQRPLRVAIVGATGAVGQEILNVLDRRQFPLASLRVFASPRSLGQFVSFRKEKIPLEVLGKNCFDRTDIAIFSAGRKIALEYAPQAVEAGAVVVDNSSAFRMDPTVPLVIPEVNAHAIEGHRGIVACPNCSTVIMLMALAPLHRAFGVKRVVAATYQAASGAGAAAMHELEQETRAILDGKAFNRTVMPFAYAFNLFTHNSPMDDKGYAEEELKMLHETRKILENDQIWINATCVRVPVLRAHSESLNISFHHPVTTEQAYSVLRQAPGLIVFEDRANNRFPMPIDASGNDAVFCGRVREDLSEPNTLDLWIVGDQLLKGAALNAVQIAELL